MTFIKNSITNNLATLIFGALFIVAISLLASTATVYAQGWDDYNYDNGWYTGGDVCTNCSNGWDDYTYYENEKNTWDDYTYYDWEPVNNDYQYDYNDYQYEYNDYQYDYPGIIYDDWDNDWNFDLSFDYYEYDDYDYYQPSVRYPTYTPTYTPSSSYYNNVVSNVTNTNTNINNNTNVNNVSSGYPVYIPPAQPQPIVNYTYPRTIVTAAQPQPRVTVAAARTGYVHINQVPYTGTNDLLYITALIVAAFGLGAVLFFHKTGVFSTLELPAFAAYSEVDESTEENVEVAEGNTLSLENGKGGPKLSFFKQK